MKRTRREFLTVSLKGAGVVSLAGSVPSFLSRFAYADATTQPAASAASGAADNVLVVIQLSGGNDGLNTIIPVGNDDYLKARPQLALKDSLHRISEQFAFNTGCAGMKELFDQGQLAVVHGCGYPKPDRSHFRSMEIWHTAQTEGVHPNGWLGHYVDHVLRGTEGLLKAVNVGPELPQALVCDGTPVPSIQSIDDFRVATDGATGFDAALEEELIRELNSARESSPAMAYLSRQATNAMLEAAEIRKVTSAYKPDADYPWGQLAPQLRLIAQLIAGNLGARLYYCQMGGFDTHAYQTGGHEELLRHLSLSLAAFHKDLKAKGLNDKVAVMCFSEFGRRVAQNSSMGTDHGAAGPMFISGGKVKGGLYGNPPSLTDLDDGDLKFTTDFRSVYATVLHRWLNADPAVVLKGHFEPLPLL